MVAYLFHHVYHTRKFQSLDIKFGILASPCAECIMRYVSHRGQSVDGGISITCPNKCTQETVILDGNIHNLPKNFSVLDIVHSSRERSSTLVASRNRFPSSDSGSNASPSSTGDYNCDVCEMSKAVIVCSSCSVVLCQSCSDDIHSRKGYQVHALTRVLDFMDSLETIDPELQAGSVESESFPNERNTCKIHQGQPLEYYCELCCDEACRLCQVTGEHREHAQECRLMADVAGEKREILRRTIETIDQCQAEWKKGFDECHEGRERLFARQRGVEAEIQSRFLRIHSALQSTEERRLSELRGEVEVRSQLLEKQAK